MTRTGRALALAGLLSGALGWWLPWVLPRNGAAALVLLGLDLGDFWKFTNEWRNAGLFQAQRLCFFLPPTLAAMGLAIWLAGGRQRGRWLLLPLVPFLGLIVLPAFEYVLPALRGNPLVYDDGTLDEAGRTLMASFAREFTGQLWLAAASLLALLLIPLWQRVGTRAQRALLVALALAGALLPAWALWYTWPVLQGFYGGAARLGPGPLLTSGGFTLATLAALLPALPKTKAREPRRPLAPDS